MIEAARILFRLAAVLIPVALAAGLVMWSGSPRSAPERLARRAGKRPVRVPTSARVDLVSVLSSYGPVEPARQWRAIAWVEGEMVETADLLSDGTFVSVGTLLVRIDHTDMRLTLARIDSRLMVASIALVRASLPGLQRDAFPVLPPTDVEVRSAWPGASPPR